MKSAGEGLSEKHRQFVPLIAAIERLQLSVPEGKAPSIHLEAAGLHETLAHGLIPHAIGEGRTVFPVLRRVTGSSDAAVEMTRDHKEMARLTDELEGIEREIGGAGLDSAHEQHLGKVLHELRDLLKHHFEAEEEVCFKVLKAELSPEQTRGMCDTMERTAAEIRSLYE